ncbi:MAG: type II toxin-antitoxin system VapC family toxin [Thermofilum sp.]
MKRFESGGRGVVDASVVVKWFVEEEHSRESKLLRDAYAAGLVDLSVPAILPFEVVNALKYSGAFSEEELKEVAKILRSADQPAQLRGGSR